MTKYGGYTKESFMWIVNPITEMFERKSIHGQNALVAILILEGCLGIFVFLLVMTFSLIFSRFFWCLFVWNVVLFFLVCIPTCVLSYFLLNNVLHMILATIGVYLLSVIIKTVIVIGRGWEIVSWS